MMDYKKQKILIVDDIIENIKILVNVFKDKYTTLFSKNGLDAIKIAKNKQPDLILLDIVMPDMNGYEVCEALKSADETADIPIIFITAMNEVEDETKGLEIGAVDYITKPFNVPIVLARVNTQLRLSEANKKLKMLYSMALDSNPLTGLPGNNSIAKKVDEALLNKEKVGILYADLDNFKAYNDKYGFANGDKIILYAEKTMETSLKKMNIKDSFIGHIGGDDFVLIVPSDKMDLVAKTIIEEFDRDISTFYNEEDRSNGHISSTNRQGNLEIYPFVSLSLAGVDLDNTGLKNYLEVNDACASTKKKAKSINGSSYFKDRRKY